MHLAATNGKPTMETKEKKGFLPREGMFTSRAASQALYEAGTSVGELIARHLIGDVGDVSAEDKQRNEEVLKKGSLFSAYVLSTGAKVCVITDPDRIATIVVLAVEHWAE
jgi:hypothetical protein